MATAANIKAGDPPMGRTRARHAGGLALSVVLKRAATSGVLYDHAVEDVAMLLGVLHDVSSGSEESHADLVAELRRKYGVPAGAPVFVKAGVR